MNITPKFYQNLWGDLQGSLNSSVWTNVTEAWDQKRYNDSFNLLLDYINPSIRTSHSNTTQTEYSVPHGSVIVNMTLKDNTLEVKCPLVDISGATKIPLMRKVAELNFHPLSLAQILLESNKLTFYYTSTLETCEPYKIYYVLKEICQTADRYDDEFTEKFKAKTFIEPNVKYATATEADNAWNNVNEIIKETLEFITYFDSQRWYGSSLDFVVVGLKRIDLCIQTQGFLKNEIERIIGECNNGNINFNERLTNGKKFLQQIIDNGKEPFVKHLYQSETFIPEKWRTNGEQVKKNIQDAVDHIRNMNNDKNYIGACLECYYLIYDLFYQNNMDHAVNGILIGSLQAASGKTWQEASGILLGGLQTVCNIQYN